MSVYDAITGGGILGPVAEIISDPLAALEAADAAIEGKRGPTPWMQRLRKPSGVTQQGLGRVPTYEGRACCYTHLTRLAHRQDLEMPYETTCPECARVFRVTLGLTVRR